MNLWRRANARGRLQTIRRKNKTAKRKADVHCRHEEQGQTKVTIPVVSSIYAASWVVICVAKLLNLQFPTRLINPRSEFTFDSTTCGLPQF